MIDARKQQNLTQKELSERTGITQADISRVLYFFFVGKKAVLTNGFVKKTMKTPKREIELAKRYRKDYEMRHPDWR